MDLAIVRPRSLTCALLAGLIWNTAFAAGQDGVPSYEWEEDNQFFVVNADGSFVNQRDLVLAINAQDAVASHETQSLRYNQAFETLEVSSAYTLKPDGRKLAVPAQQIHEETYAGARDATLFADLKVRRITFPDVAAGDRLVMHYALSRFKPLIPGQFQHGIVPLASLLKHASVSYDLPDSLHLSIDDEGFSASTAPSGPGRTQYRWDFNRPVQGARNGSEVAATESGSRLRVSTFKDLAVLASAYQAGSRGKDDVTPDIAELAAKITARLDRPEAQARALANWVRANIRFIAVGLDGLPLASHNADLVLENRYGDAKDHENLLAALLAARGIGSTAALINSGRVYAMPAVASLEVLAHVATYVPSLDLYLDAADSRLLGSYLLATELDKPTLLTRTGNVGHTPLSQLERVSSTTTYHVAADGSADVESAVQTRGVVAGSVQKENLARKPAERESIVAVQRAMTEQHLKGSVTTTGDAFDQENSQYETRYAGHLSDLIEYAGLTNLAAAGSLTGTIAHIVAGMDAERKKGRSFFCSGGDYDEQARYELPSDSAIIALPASADLHDANVDYTSEYIRLDRAVMVKRHFTFHHAGRVCRTNEFKTLQVATDRIVSDLKRQIFLRMPPAPIPVMPPGKSS
jgi:transglutaminase-like putative cysteine protease